MGECPRGGVRRKVSASIVVRARLMRGVELSRRK